MAAVSVFGSRARVLATGSVRGERPCGLPRSRLLDHRRAESLPRPAPAPATVPIGHDPRKRQECQKKRAAAGPPFCSLPLPIPLPLWGRVREGVFAQLLADRIEVYAALL